ncbi:MAG: FHA domain-containing protein [Polyangiales bacterium]
MAVESKSGVARTNLTITVIAGGEPGRVWEFVKGATMRVGASAAGEVVLAGDEWVAATHCALYWDKGGWRVRDLGEGGGTWRNGVGVTDEAVESGDVIQCGRTQVRVEWVEEIAGEERGGERDPKAEALATLRALPGRLYAVLDAAKDPEVLQLLRRSGYRYECLYTGWARDVYGEAAPYLVQLRKQGRLLAQLVMRNEVLWVTGPLLTFEVARTWFRRSLVVSLDDELLLKNIVCSWPHPQSESATLRPGKLSYGILVFSSGENSLQPEYFPFDVSR